MTYLYPNATVDTTASRSAARWSVRLLLIILAVAPLILCSPARALAAAPVSVQGPVTTKSQRDWLDYLQVVAIVAALLSLLLIRRQLRSSDKAARQERAAELAAVWTDRSFRPVLSPVWSFMGISDVQGCIERIRSWMSAPHSEDACLLGDEGAPSARKNDINHVFGVIEDVAIRYNGGSVDRDWVERMLGPALVSLFDRCLWFIVFFRSMERWPSLVNEWETMVRDLRQSRAAASLSWWHPIRKGRAMRKRRRQRRQKTYAQITCDSAQIIRILCLPPDPRKASGQDWSRAAQLSAILAEREQTNGGAGLSESSVSDDTRTSRWSAIVVPRSIDGGPADIEHDEQLSARLNAYLSGMTAVAIDEAIAGLRGGVAGSR